MSQASSILRGAWIACALCVASVPALAGNHPKAAKDPARWTTGDTTKAQRMATLKKEINAAYAEQQTACKHKSPGSRAACLKQARQIYQHDMAHAPQLLAQAPKGEVSERVVSTTTAAPAAPTQPGATAYGNSTMGTSGAGTGKDDAVPPSTGQTSGLPPQNMHQQDMQEPNVPPQSSPPPVQQQ
jgi:hypothetical protein